MFLSRIIELIRRFMAQLANTTTTTTTTATTATHTAPSIETGGKKMKLALCVGINKYPNPANNLAGCVNDANDFAELLKGQYGFDEVRILTDSDATLQNVSNDIAELLDKRPDVFVMTNSSHGTRIVSREEDDGYCEAICLYDKFLMDHDFKKILSHADPKTHITIVSDSCHSSGVTRAFLMAMNDSSYISVPKYLPSPDNMEAIMAGMSPTVKAIFEPDEAMNEVLMAGCKSDQYSYDASFSDRPNGAFSYYTIQLLKANPYITYGDFVAKMTANLPSSRYPQTPVIETRAEMKDKTVFG